MDCLWVKLTRIDDTLIHAISNVAGGLTLTIIGHPFDTIKSRMQTMSVVGTDYSAYSLKSLPYRNSIDCLFKSLRNEGVRKALCM